MELTRHAQARMQQRGIRNVEVECLLQYGRVEYDHHGGQLFYLDKSARRRLAGKIGARMAERVGDVYVVVATDGAILTVGHRIHHIRRY